ncbi:MAG: hypothetical protein GY759_02425 [Chloroflexi bacterium]|nr:hypothetical protein [Chloroflexota bacterium]
MILEMVILDVKPGQEAGFEVAFSQAQAIIAAMPGYVGHELHHCLEHEHRYLQFSIRVPWAIPWLVPPNR